MKNRLRFKAVRLICSFLPPIITQQVRNKLLNFVPPGIGFGFDRKSFVGGNLKGDTNDFHALRFYIHGFFEWRIIVLAKKIIGLQPGDIIEVGANVGTETVSLAKINYNNKVHAFEPLDMNFRYLEQIKQINNFKSLQLYKMLVSDIQGKVSFKIPSTANSGSGHIIETSGKDSKIMDVVTLDEKLKNMTSCSLIIMDVEGFEFNVLRGSVKIITKFKPFLILEVNPGFLKERAKISVQILYNYLIQRGYYLYYIDKMDLKQIDIKNYENSKGKNWICIPAGQNKNLKILSQSIFKNAINPFLNFKIF